MAGFLSLFQLRTHEAPAFNWDDIGRTPGVRPRIVARWHRDDDGRLACRWHAVADFPRESSG